MPPSLWLPAVVAWLGTGIIGLVLIAAATAPAPAWLWVAGAIPVSVTLPFMILQRPGSYLIALFGSVGYAGLALTEAIASPDTRLWSAALAAVSLLAFFSLIPAVRSMRRRMR